MTSERLDITAPLAAGEASAVVDEADLTVIHHHPMTGVLSWYPRLKERRRIWMAIRGFREVLLIAGVYSLYDATRFLVAGKSSVALAHGRSILRFEKAIGLAPEHWLNKLFSAHLALGLSADYIYATLHYIVTPVVLVWMWRRHGSAYSQARSVLMVATILALVGFSLLPVAPPRLLPSFIDTMAKYSHYGWWSTAASAPRGFGADTNQYAAVPSLHVGWALWCGWQLVRYGRHRVTKVVGVLYPILLSVVVMATANHYLVDVVAGGVIVLLAFGVVRLLTLAGLVLPPGAEAPDLPAGAEPAVV
jgi:PAP2 superfamily